MRLPQKFSYYSRCYLSIVDGHDASAGLHRDLLLWQVLCAERGQQAAARVPVPAHRGGQPLIHVHSVIPTLHLHMHSYCTHFKLTKKKISTSFFFHLEKMAGKYIKKPIWNVTFNLQQISENWTTENQILNVRMYSGCPKTGRPVWRTG